MRASSLPVLACFLVGGGLLIGNVSGCGDKDGGVDSGPTGAGADGGSMDGGGLDGGTTDGGAKDGGTTDGGTTDGGTTDGGTTDGGTDTDCPDPVVAFYDADGDGFGDDDLQTELCTSTAGYALVGGDCDDLRDDVNPGLPEVCDGLDNNCDGTIDPDDTEGAPTWYVDADGDGYGDDAVTVVACDMPSNGASVGGDCDDTDALSSPGRTETCSDGIDNDCDGVDVSCSLPASGPITGVGNAILGEVDYGTFGGNLGTSVGHGDFDGDGQADLFAGGTAAAGGYQGGVYVVLGPFVADVTSSDADASLVSSDTSTEFGQTAVAVDIDGDGYDELAVGAWTSGAGSSAGGAVYLATGPVSGALELSDMAHLSSAGDYRSCADGLAAGDLTGDDRADLIVGCSAQSAYDRIPAVAILDDLTPGTDATIDDASVILTAEHFFHRAGRALAVGDVDGDGILDLAIGAPSYGANGTSSFETRGAIYVGFGPLTASVDMVDLDIIVTGVDDYQQLGSSVCMGDIDGDGVDELMGGSYMADDGAGGYQAQLGIALDLPASGSTDDDLDATVVFDSATDGTFSVPCAVFDPDNDSAPDLATGNTAGGGQLYLFTAITAGTYSTGDAWREWTGSKTSWLDADFLGARIVAVPDATGDGVDDLIVGAPGSDSGMGRAWVIQTD